MIPQPLILIPRADPWDAHHKGHGFSRGAQTLKVKGICPVKPRVEEEAEGRLPPGPIRNDGLAGFFYISLDTRPFEIPTTAGSRKKVADVVRNLYLV